MSILFSLWVVRVGEICMRPTNGAAGARKKWGCGVEKRGWLFSILFCRGFIARRTGEKEWVRVAITVIFSETMRCSAQKGASLSFPAAAALSSEYLSRSAMLGLQLCHNGGAQLAAGKVKENLTLEYDGKEYNHSRLNWEQDITTVTAAETFHFPSAARARYRGAKKREKLLFSLSRSLFLSLRSAAIQRTYKTLAHTQHAFLHLTVLFALLLCISCWWWCLVAIPNTQSLFLYSIASLWICARVSLANIISACVQEIYAPRERNIYIRNAFSMEISVARTRAKLLYNSARVYIFIHISCKSFFSSALSPLFSSHCSIDRKTFNLGFSPRTARKICGKIFYIDKGSERSRWFIYFCVYAEQSIWKQKVLFCHMKSYIENKVQAFLPTSV